ncbi:condensation domain-containing protein, partial [Micromonospora sp. NPDC047074]|uniref:condensation domain-containing protein n=1 Tax=Micromonospora sp. NPDC047074 TaxID=3154339 RepID=UPI0033C9AF61
VPHSIIALPHFPLTRNGKIDRTALPTPDTTTRSEAPRDDLERQVAEVWADVIGRAPGRDDNYFAFGGHSMQATMIAARLREQLRVPVAATIVFEAQTVAAMADLLRAGTTPADSSSTVERGEVGGSDPVARVAPGQSVPGRVLSFAQQRLWFLHTLDPNSTAYNTQTAWHIDGEINLDHLENAITEITRRHEVLRTTFTEHDGIPHQVIHPTPHHHTTRHDLTHIDPRHHDHHIHTILRSELDKPFDLTAGPLLRCQILTLTPTTHILCLTWHHIVLDGWSVNLLHNELHHLYTDLIHQRPPSLPPLKTQYADIAQRQRHRWETTDAQDHLHQLAARLRDAPPICHPPTDRPRPDTTPGPTAVHRTELPTHALSTLHTLATHTGSTPFGILLAAFQLLIHRYTTQNPVVIGTPLAGRTDPDAEKLIGFFVNTLPLAVDIHPHHTFRQFLRHSRTVLMHAVTHQDIPFDKLVEHTQPTRNRHTPPLIQTVFTGGNVTGIADEAVPLHTATMRPLPAVAGAAKFDLTVHTEVGTDAVEVFFNYARELYEPGTIADLADSYRALVTAVLTEPDRPLSTVETVTDTQRKRLMAAATGRTAVGATLDGCVPRLVTETALRQPDAVAVVDGAGALTYRQLDEWSNHLAHELLRHGAR